MLEENKATLKDRERKRQTRARNAERWTEEQVPTAALDCRRACGIRVWTAFLGSLVAKSRKLMSDCKERSRALEGVCVFKKRKD